MNMPQCVHNPIARPVSTMVATEVGLETQDKRRLVGGKAGIRPDASGSSIQNGAFTVVPVAVTLADARIMSGLSIPTLYRLMRRGQLDTVKVGRRRLVKVESINRLVGAA